MAYIGRTPAYGTFERQSLSPDGSTTTFSLNFTVGSSASILVNVAGVVQEPESAYNIASGGTQIVFTAAPASGDAVYLIYLGLVSDNTSLLSTTSITGQTELSADAASDDVLLIFDTSATALRKISVTNLLDNRIGASKYNTRNSTGDGSTVAFTITSGHNVDSVLVTENGVLQKPTTDYTISGTTLTFGTAPASGVAISIRELLI